jgi:hypothetical protein
VPTVRVGDWVVLAVENRSARRVNAVAIDLAPDWSVGGVHPDEQFHPLEAGERWLLPLRVALPDGLDGGVDVMKVIATVGPPPPFEMLTLPQLDRPVSRSVSRSGSRASGNPLTDLFDVVTADAAPTRNVVSVPATAAGDWTVSQVELRTRA